MAQLKSTNVTGNLAVTGNINGGKILENGTNISDKYQAKGSYLTSVPPAESDTLGGIKIGYTDGTVAGSSVQKGVQLDTNNKAYVEVTKKNITDTLGYTPPSTDTKNTVGSTNKTSTTLYLVGVTGASNTPQVSNVNTNCYIGSDNYLYSNGAKVLTSHQSLSGYATQTWVNNTLGNYLPKSGGSFNDSVDVTWTKYNRKMIINGNNITFDPTADTGTYAGSLLDVKHTKGTTTAVGVYGNYSEGLTHIFMGGSYSDPAMKMDASGNFTFKNLVTLTHDKAQLQFRGGHASYDGVISYQTSGNEAMVFTTKNVVTSFMFVNGEDTVKNVSNARWTALTPGLQIKNNKVSIGKLIADGVTPTYNLDVGGTANATTLYESGESLSDKYQPKGTYITPTTGSEYYPKYIQTRLQNKTSWYGAQYPIYAWWETNSICKWVVDNYETKVDRAVKDASGNTITSYYQPKLTSGNNIKTINNTSLLGSGNINLVNGNSALYWSGRTALSSLANTLINASSEGALVLVRVDNRWDKYGWIMGRYDDGNYDECRFFQGFIGDVYGEIEQVSLVLYYDTVQTNSHTSLDATEIYVIGG